jgi:hypothetical protein
MKYTGTVKSWLAAGALSVACAGAFSAVVVDLRPGKPGGPISSGTIDGATYTFGKVQPAGSGVIDSFVRVTTNDPIVQGYNTTANNIYDTGNTDTFNHEITVGQVGFMGTDASGNGGFMRLLLDINQIGNPTSSYLSLDELQIFISTTPNQAVEPALAQQQLVPFVNRALVYQMDGTDAGNQVLLDYDWNSGSGETDMTLELTRTMFDSAFTALGLTSDAQKNAAYIYVYSRFGETWPNNDGYEEWAYRRGDGIPIGCVPSEENNFCRPQEIPEPGALALVGLALGIAGGVSRRRAKA